jgi:hypothetical protein
MGISSRVFFLHRYRGKRCRHDLLLRVHVPAYSNADQGAEDAAWAFGESAALHLRTWWERYELVRECSREHEQTLVGEASEDAVEWADDDHEPLFGPGLRELDVWVAPGLTLASAERVIEGSERHRVYLLTDEDGQGDLSAR